jgi:hypothetical protein
MTHSNIYDGTKCGMRLKLIDKIVERREIPSRPEARLAELPAPGYGESTPLTWVYSSAS